MEENTIKREDYAPITQGLREYIERHPTMMCAVGLTDLCDNIDAIHKALEQKSAGMLDFCERVEQAAQARKDVMLWGVDYAPLPLDADGVPVHVGDKVIDWETPRLVVAVSEDSICLAGYESDSYYRMGIAKNYHHKPTVADVLRELWDESHNDLVSYSPSDRDAIIERFAKRLQLAEGDAE